LDVKEGIAEDFADSTGPESGPRVEKGETDELRTGMCCDEESVRGSDEEWKHGDAGLSANLE
jgi:hypothetical protein